MPQSYQVDRRLARTGDRCGCGATGWHCRLGVANDRRAAMTEAHAASLPLAQIRVLEFTQNIMGPSAGLILADLGADVTKIEPAPAGDSTRRLSGFAAGFFGYFNRNKRSLAVDLKHPAGRDLV